MGIRPAQVALAALNALLIVAVLCAGWLTFREHEPSDAPRVPRCDPAKRAIQEARRSPLVDTVAVVWNEIDRPPPFPERVVEAPKPVPTFAERVACVSAYLSAEAPNLNCCIVAPRSRPEEQISLRVGDSWAGFTLTRIERAKNESGKAVARATFTNTADGQVSRLEVLSQD